MLQLSKRLYSCMDYLFDSCKLYYTLAVCIFVSRSCETVSADCTCVLSRSYDWTVLCSPAVRAIVEIARSVDRYV